MNMIDLKELVKNYPNTKAVDGVSLTIRQGEIYGLLGPNGAGKSTTIGMISTLVKPTAGEIIVKGQDLSQHPHVVKQLIGLVPQEIALYPTLTAGENLNFWGKMYGLSGEELRKRKKAVLETVGLADREKTAINTFSGGMKRRINIAVGLINEPEILIMDEPTVGVDPQSRNHILETVKELNRQGMTVLYTSHYMEEVEYLCDRIGIMDHGKLIAEGTKEELVQLVGDNSKVKIQAKGLSETIIAELKALPQVADISLSEDQLDVLTPNGEVLLPELIQRLVKHGCKVEAMQVVEPDLESVFLHLTGRALRD